MARKYPVTLVVPSTLSLQLITREGSGGNGPKLGVFLVKEPPGDLQTLAWLLIAVAKDATPEHRPAHRIETPPTSTTTMSESGCQPAFLLPNTYRASCVGGNLVVKCREALGRQQPTFIDLPRPPPAPQVDAEEITWLLVRREWSSHDVFTHSADESRVVKLRRSPTRSILELIASKWLRVEWKCETPLTALTTNDCPNRTLGRRTP
ncbi:hypothetical protein HYQ46_011951 [Verticillium longisporum]|nr:hypothetical protein HYQ46_011951 [Verticillium longisporum]